MLNFKRDNESARVNFFFYRSEIEGFPISYNKGKGKLIHRVTIKSL